MKQILHYLRQYFYGLHKGVFVLVSILTAVLIFLNYHFHIDQTISSNYSFVESLGSRWLLFLLSFGLPYCVVVLVKNVSLFKDPMFGLLLLIAPAIFSLKIALDLPINFSDNPNWNNYWQHILYWPLL